MDRQPCDGIDRRCIKQWQEIGQKQEGSGWPPPSQASKRNLHYQASDDRSEAGTPHNEAAKRCGLVMTMEDEGVGDPAEKAEEQKKDCELFFQDFPLAHLRSWTPFLLFSLFSCNKTRFVDWASLTML